MLPWPEPSSNERPGGVQKPCNGFLVGVGPRIAGQITLDVLDGCLEDVQRVVERIELAAGDDQLGFGQADLTRTPASLVVALAAARSAVRPGPAGDVRGERSPAPPAPPCLGTFRHVTKGTAPTLRRPSIDARLGR